MNEVGQRGSYGPDEVGPGTWVLPDDFNNYAVCPWRFDAMRYCWSRPHAGGSVMFMSRGACPSDMEAVYEMAISEGCTDAWLEGEVIKVRPNSSMDMYLRGLSVIGWPRPENI